MRTICRGHTWFATVTVTCYFGLPYHLPTMINTENWQIETLKVLMLLHIPLGTMQVTGPCIEQRQHITSDSEHSTATTYTKTILEDQRSLHNAHHGLCVRDAKHKLALQSWLCPHALWVHSKQPWSQGYDFWHSSVHVFQSPVLSRILNQFSAFHTGKHFPFPVKAATVHYIWLWTGI